MPKPDRDRGSWTQMSNTKSIKLIIVDDHPMVRHGIKTMLLTCDDMWVIGEAGNGRDALALCKETQPDVILMDVVMPGMDGLETTRAILERYPQVNIVVLTSFPDPDLVQKALEAGAVGYLLKDTPIDTLGGAIRSASAGQSFLAPEAAQALIQARASHQKLGHDLTAREREVLALIVEGLSNDEIADRLVVSTNTVRKHVSACISKLGASNRAQAAALAVRHQLISDLTHSP
jgi:NarL family two-component system response regulator LiaR